MDRWQPVLRIAFKGPRFADAALDVDAMPELWAYRSLVTKLAESIWRQEHPSSQRLKKGFAAQFRMRCSSFEAGSTVAALERSVDGQLTLDGTGDVFDRAMTLVDEVVTAANHATTLPHGFPRDCLPLFRAWGKTLGEGESLELRTPDDSVRTVYTPASRAYLVGLIETAYEDFADMRGHVLATSLRKGRFELYPDLETGPGIEVPLSDQHEATVLEALSSYQDTLVRVVGHVAYAADGHPLRFIEVESIEAWDPDAQVDNGSDVDWVVYGSLARREWTSGSDVDWTLLVDAPVDNHHAELAHEIQKVVARKDPSKGGAFGTMCFSPELVHKIGGNDDTNQNTTRRVLLLLESATVGGGAAHDRVLRALLDRYLDDDLDHVAERSGLPRFLLNDIVRYWRTMAVDFAAKQKAQAGEKWGLRHFKLRMSRKLMFTAGLLVCLQANRDLQGAADRLQHLDYLVREFSKTPLEVLRDAANRLPIDQANAVDMFSQYDKFLEVLGDSAKRNSFECLTSRSDAVSDPLFQECRTISKAFQQGLLSLFASDPDLMCDAFRYGVF